MRPVQRSFTSNRYPSPSWNKPVFQMYPPRGYITVQDARDVYDLCSTYTSPKTKEAIYLMHGMDGEAVEKYLHVVEQLYLCYHMPCYKGPASVEKEIVYKQIPTVSWVDLVKVWVLNWSYHQMRRK